MRIKQRLKDLTLDAFYVVTHHFESNQPPSSIDRESYQDCVRKKRKRSEDNKWLYPKIYEYKDVVFYPKLKALYTLEGLLIKESAIVRWGITNFVSAPERINPSVKEALPVVNHARYGGILFDNHFGHFICESLSRLWPLVNRKPRSGLSPETWIFANSSGAPNLDRGSSFLNETLSSLEKLGMSPMIVNEPVLIRTVEIPESVHQIGIAGHPIFRKLCSRVGLETLKRHGDDIDNPFEGGRVYLSRTQLNSARRRIVGETALEERLHRLGFRVVYPERLPFKDQIALYAGANTVVGCIGSAFHAQIFAPKICPRVICITDMHPSQTFFNFDAMCGVKSKYVLGLSDSRFSSRYIKHQVLSVDDMMKAVEGLC